MIINTNIFVNHITELFYALDIFWKNLTQSYPPDSKSKNTSKNINVKQSKAMTTTILFYQSSFWLFKYFDFHISLPTLQNKHILNWRTKLHTLTTFFHQVKGQDIQISIINSTKITVCYNLRIQGHRIFKDIVLKAKSSID